MVRGCPGLHFALLPSSHMRVRGEALSPLGVSATAVPNPLAIAMSQPLPGPSKHLHLVLPEAWSPRLAVAP